MQPYDLVSEYRIMNVYCEKLGMQMLDVKKSLDSSGVFKRNFSKEYKNLESEYSRLDGWRKGVIQQRGKLMGEIEERGLHVIEGDPRDKLKAEYEFYSRELQRMWKITKRIPKRNTAEGELRAKYFQEMISIEKKLAL